MTIYAAQRAKDRRQLELSARGLVAEAMDWKSMRDFATTVATSGSAFYSLVGLRAGDVITGVISHCQTSAGSGLTLIKQAIWTKTGTLGAASASVHATYTTGFNTVPFTSAYTVPADDAYYIGIVTVGTTGPTLTRCSALAASGVVLNGGARPFGLTAGQTDAANITLGDGSTAFWFAAY